MEHQSKQGSRAGSRAGSRPGTPRPAEEKAVKVHLPSNLPSANQSQVQVFEEERPDGTTRQVELHPVAPQQIVTGEVVQDAKTRKLYVKHKGPSYSLAHTKNAPTLAPMDHGNVIGLAHAFPRTSSEAPSRPGSLRTAPRAPGSHAGSRPASFVGSSVGGHHGEVNLNAAHERDLLLQQLRTIIREEVRASTRGHAEDIKNHTEDQLKAAVEDLAAELPSAQENGAAKVDGVREQTTDAPGSDDTVMPDDTDERPPQLRQQRTDGVVTALPAVEDEIEEEEGEEPDFPNPWTKLRYHLREPFAEMLGTFMLIVFGTGGNNQVTLSNLYDPSGGKGSYLSINWGWGIGVIMGIYASGGISGGLINPAVTVALAVFRGFPWWKVPIYIVAQIAGAYLGALCVYGVYVVPTRILDPNQTLETACLYTTCPADFIRTRGTRIVGFYNETLASAVLLIIVCSLGDANNTPPVDGMAPLIIGFAVLGIGATLGWQSAYAINPARDLGPRLMLWTVGYSPKILWTYDAGYFAYTPLLGSLVGACLGAFIYDALVYSGAESPVNKAWSWAGLRQRTLRRRNKKVASPAFSADTDLSPESIDSAHKA